LNILVVSVGKNEQRARDLPLGLHTQLPSNYRHKILMIHPLIPLLEEEYLLIRATEEELVE
jgi:hypothetical protein